MEDNDDASSVGANGWRQGSVAGQDLLLALAESGEFSPPQDCALIVISHDCDVVNPSFRKEPVVEGVWAQRADHLSGDLVHGKNSRSLQVAIQDGAAEILHEVSAHRRLTFDRRLLAKFKPSGQKLDRGQKKLIATWIAKRYDRSAFPSSFNRRLPERSLKKALKQGGTWITALYLNMVDDELPESEKYEVVLLAAMKRSDYDDPDCRFQAQNCLNELTGMLGASAGIEIVHAELVAEAQISVEDLRSLKRWDFDWISLAADEDY